MTTVAVLLRSLVRICGAEAALVARDGTHHVIAAFGVPAASAVSTFAALRNGVLPADGLSVAWTVAVRHRRGDTGATVYVLAATACLVDPPLARIIGLLAAEIGNELENVPALKDGCAALVDRIAPGIDVLHDAAAIIEWPAGGIEPRFLYVNRAFESLFGYASADVVGAAPHLLHGPLTDAAGARFVNDQVPETAVRLPIVYYRRDGVPIWVEVSLRAISGTPAAAACTVAAFLDVTARKEFEFALAKEKRKLQVTLAAIGDGVITTVADGRVDFVNIAARSLLGIEPADARGRSIGDVLGLRDGSGARMSALPADGSSGAHRGQAHFGGPAGPKEIAFVSSPVGDEGYVVVLRDVTVQQRQSTQLSYEASHDPLTSIYNRRKFEQVLEAAIGSARRDSGPHALAFLDLDRFKAINDTCGHAMGDRVLRDISSLLQAELRGDDVVARIGGDEFAVLLHDCSLDDARGVFEILRRIVETQRFGFEGKDYSVGVSIGITAIDGLETQSSRVVARADAACYAAKQAGRNAIAG